MKFRGLLSCILTLAVKHDILLLEHGVLMYRIQEPNQ